MSLPDFWTIDSRSIPITAGVFLVSRNQVAADSVLVFSSIPWWFDQSNLANWTLEIAHHNHMVHTTDGRNPANHPKNVENPGIPVAINYWWSPDFCCASTGTSKGQGFCVLVADGGTNPLPKQPQTLRWRMFYDLLLDSVKPFENIANKLGNYSIPAVLITPRSLVIFTQFLLQVVIGWVFKECLDPRFTICGP